MSYSRTWTPAENQKLLDAVRSARSVDEAVEAARKAFPREAINTNSINTRFRRYGWGTLQSNIVLADVVHAPTPARPRVDRDALVEHRLRTRV